VEIQHSRIIINYLISLIIQKQTSKQLLQRLQAHHYQGGV